jgi:hypothetical protein
MKNPFVDVFHWTKGQILDLNAISAAIVSRGFVEQQEKKLTAKKISDQKDLDNLNAGKTSVGTLFKSKGDAGNIAQKVEMTEKDIASTTALKDLLTIYIGEKVIPEFKKNKLDLYG